MSEACFRALIENSMDVASIVDSDARVRYVSPSVTRVLGYAPEELIGSTSLDFVHPDDAPVIGDLFARAIERPGVMETNEFRARHKDGTWRIMEAVGLNMLDDPAVRGMVVTARDVTARRALEDRLRQAERLDAVSQLAGAVAHDFNNVLLVIRGYSSVLRAALDDEQQIADVDEIVRAADRAAELTRRLLAFGRRQVLQPRMLGVDEVVRDLDALLRRAIPADIDVEIEVGAGVPSVVADPAQIEESILNLAFNARDAMPAGGTLTISVGDTVATGAEHGIAPPLPPGRYVTLAVADTGTGIAADVLPHIFEPFFTTKEDGVGTGLGLSTVYGVVAQTGGGIEVRPREGGGTIFTLYLPAAAAIEETATGGPTAAAGAGSETILLVEDEDSVRELVARVLASGGYTVLSASRPSEAERLLDETPHVDLLLTDVVMPEMSGYDLAERVRDRRPETRRLFISGYSHRAGAAQSRERLLKKPFAPEELTRAVREALDDRGMVEIG